MPSAFNKRYEQDLSQKETALLKRNRKPIIPYIKCIWHNEDGVQCTKEAIYLSNPPYCLSHGGRTYSNYFPNWLTNDMGKGRWAPYLRKSHQERFIKALEDPELLSLEEDLALIDTRIVDLLEKLSTGENGDNWANLANLVNAYRKTKRRYFKNTPVTDGVIPDAILISYLDQMEKIVEGGVNEYVAWKEIREVLGERKNLGESERKRIIEAKQTLTMEQAEHMRHMIFQIIKKNVKDPVAVSRIATEMQALIGAEIQTRAKLIEG